MLHQVYLQLKIINECTQTSDLNFLDAKNATHQLKTELNDEEWTDVIEKFCTDDYGDWEKTLDFDSGVRRIPWLLQP